MTKFPEIVDDESYLVYPDDYITDEEEREGEQGMAPYDHSYFIQVYDVDQDGDETPFRLIRCTGFKRASELYYEQDWVPGRAIYLLGGVGDGGFAHMSHKELPEPEEVWVVEVDVAHHTTDPDTGARVIDCYSIDWQVTPEMTRRDIERDVIAYLEGPAGSHGPNTTDLVDETGEWWQDGHWHVEIEETR